MFINIVRYFLVGLIIFLFNNNFSFAISLDFNGFIADEANILSDQEKNDLNVTLYDLQKKSGADIAVVTLKTLQGKSAEDVAIDIGRSYRVGDKHKNNGVVFLTAIEDRKMRIELGYGLENKISISSLSEIRDNDILPYYRQENYRDGILRGTYILAKKVAEVEGVQIRSQGFCPTRQNSNRQNENYPWWVYPLAFLLALTKRRFNNSSFGGFGGGGGFGGSGCSGSW